MDPKEVHGEDFPGETFRVLKEKEVRLYRYALVGRQGWYWRRGMGRREDEFCYGEDFTGETVRVLKEKEVRLYGNIGRQGWCWMHGQGKDEGGMMIASREFCVACGEDFTGETVRVLREKEARLYGEYRTSRLVLVAWDEMQG